MELVKIRFDDNRYSWTVVDRSNQTVESIRNWIVHLEETRLSPNTIEAYARHLARFASYLEANKKDLGMVRLADYDHFLQWLPHSLGQSSSGMMSTAKIFHLQASVKPLSASLKNQVHLAMKSYYRYMCGSTPFLGTGNTSNHYQGVDSYKPFLEHINHRKSTKQKDRYLSGNLGKV